jgi:hypothetical protein
MQLSIRVTARPLIHGALCVAALVLAYFFGDSYIGRLPHHAGYFLVPVEDTVAAPVVRPRHTVLVVVDGLSRDVAERFDSARRIQAEGQCRMMHVGPITVSRPVYAVMSTGLEQDRSGCRNNDETSPLAAESVWQAARRSGLRVRGVSAVPWWRQLFTDGFDDYRLKGLWDDAFADVELSDLTLIHPLYVDDVGHRLGAASPEYQSAAARADREIGSLLDRLDLAQDLVVLTADHGHMSYGGHGGPQREIAEVLTCFGGRGVARRSERGRMDALSLGPALAVLSGVPFPRHMRALEDDLAVLFDIADPDALPAAYLVDRRAAVDRFRAESEARLRGWLGSNVAPSWTELYAREQSAQHARLTAGLVLLGLVLALSLWRRGRGIRGALGFLIWAGLTLAGTLALYAAVRGSLDFTSINARVEFLRAGLGVCGGVAIAAAAGHRLYFADRGRLLADELTLVALATGANVLHPIVYGWSLGFPLPGAGLLFFPFFVPLFIIVHALIGLALCLAPLVARVRSPSPSLAGHDPGEGLRARRN